eukprot:1509182-Heterocapsa_arctica.AAC.1
MNANGRCQGDGGCRVGKFPERHSEQVSAPQGDDLKLVYDDGGRVMPADDPAGEANESPEGEAFRPGGPAKQGLAEFARHDGD